MTALIATLCLLLPAGQSHAGLHPADVDLFVESPDVPALLAAYDQAPMARLLADEEANQALCNLLGLDGLTGKECLAWGFDVLPLSDGLAAKLFALLAEVSSASVSWRAKEPDEAGAVVVDFKSPAAAARAAAHLTGPTSDEEEPGAEGPRVLPLDMLPALELWLRIEGPRLVLGAGAYRPETYGALRSGEAASLGDRAERPALPEPAGAVVLQGFHRRPPISMVLERLGEEGEMNGLLREVEAWLFGRGLQLWRMQLAGSRFVTETLDLPTEAAQDEGAWLATTPVDTGVLDLVHPGAMAVFASTIDGPRFGRWILARLAAARGEAAEHAPAGIRDRLGFDPLELFGRLGPDLVVFAFPIKGIGLPKTFAFVDVEDPEVFFAGLVRLSEVLAEEIPGFRARSSKYKKVPYVSLTLPEDLASLGDFGIVRPAIAVLDGRLVVTGASMQMKAEIRRMLDPEGAGSRGASYPWTEANGRAPVPDGATSLLYVDWGLQVDGLFSMARAFGPMFGQMAGGIPFDLASLPPAQVFTRHIRPTLRTVRRTEAGILTRHEASFGWETWVGLTGLVAKAVEEMTRAFAASLDAATGEAVAPEPPVAVTAACLADLRTALTVYRLDAGRFPERLDLLGEPTPSYPSGFLQAGEVPVDGWSRPFRYESLEEGRGYRLWSVGPDGVDQGGEGDDVEGP